MDSMPPATTISLSPSMTACAASATAFNPEPQTLLMGIAATRGSHPPFSAAWREGFCPSPAWTTLPRIASSICFVSSPARRAASATTLPPSSGAEKLDRPPWNLPTGVRTAERITGVSISSLQRSKLHYSDLRFSPLSRLRFVGGGAVEAGNRNVEQTEINRELATVMNQMIHDHSTDAG